MRWERSTCNSSEHAGRVMLIHVGTYPSASQEDSVAAISVQPLGIVSRPVSPTMNASGQISEASDCLLARHGSECFAMPTTDPRALARIPTGEEGSTTVYAPASQSIIHLSADGSINVIAFVSETETMAFTLDVANKQALIRDEKGGTVQVAAGHVKLFASEATTLDVAPGSKIALNANVTITGSLSVIGKISQGLAPSLPAATGGGPGSLPNSNLLLTPPTP